MNFQQNLQYLRFTKKLMTNLGKTYDNGRGVLIITS